jgi:hypothetical protein
MYYVLNPVVGCGCCLLCWLLSAVFCVVGVGLVLAGVCGLRSASAVCGLLRSPAHQCHVPSAISHQRSANARCKRESSVQQRGRAGDTGANNPTPALVFFRAISAEECLSVSTVAALCGAKLNSRLTPLGSVLRSAPRLLLGPITGDFDPPPPHAIDQPPNQTPSTDTGAESQGV